MLLAILTIAIYASPIVVAFSSPISGLIFGFALWEAWKINRRVQLVFNGPFRLSTAGSQALVFEVDDES